MASTVLNLMLATLSLLAVLLAIFAPALVPLLVPGFDEATTALTVELTRMMLIAPIFLAAGSIVTAILQTQDRFGATALAPVVYNASIIVCALLLGRVMGIYGVAVGVVVGAIGHAARPATRPARPLHLLAARGSYTIRPRGRRSG